MRAETIGRRQDGSRIDGVLRFSFQLNCKTNEEKK
jgi:hypothetical protein